MYIEERLKFGIDVCLVYLGVGWLSNFLYQIVTAMVNSISILTFTSKYLSIFLAVKPILLLLLLAVTSILSRKYRLQINDMVFIVSGLLLICSSLSAMAMVFHSVIMSVEQANQAQGINEDLLKQLAINNYISAADNVLNLLSGIFLVFFGEKRIKKYKAHPGPYCRTGDNHANITAENSRKGEAE